MKLKFINLLTHSFPMHPFATPWKHKKSTKNYVFNPFTRNAPFFYSLKTSENH